MSRLRHVSLYNKSMRNVSISNAMGDKIARWIRVHVEKLSQNVRVDDQTVTDAERKDARAKIARFIEEQY